MKKRLWAIFALLVVFALGFAALAACTPPDPGPGGDDGGETEEPVDNTLQYLGDLSKALAETIALNPEKGFNMDLGAELGWHFKDAEKAAAYDWSYAFSVKANVFADGKEGMAIELKDTKTVDNSENPTTGGGGGQSSSDFITPRTKTSF